MKLTTERRDKLLGTMNERYETLTYQEKVDLAFGGKKPQWLHVLHNITYLSPESKGFDKNKRLLRPMLKSNDVVSFLNTVKEQVDTLVSKRDEEINGEYTHERGETISLQQETKKEFISILEYIIQEREMSEFLVSKNSVDKYDYYRFSDHFKDLKELYDFLLEVSQRSEGEIKDFILDEIPSFSWDQSFGISK